MTTTTVAAASRFSRPRDSVHRKTSLVVWYWAVAGGFFTLLQIWIFGQWFAYDFYPTDPGPSYVPAWMGIIVTANDIFWGIAILATAYFVVLRPKMRSGRVSFDGLFCMAFIFAWWQDPLLCYLVQASTYTSLSFNMGSWACHIPGWQSPNGCRISEPLTWNFSFYFVISALATIAASKIMQKLKARYRAIRTEVLFAGLFVVIGVLDVIVEFSWVSMGIYHYGGVSNHLAVFDDTRFKFPLWEPFAVGWLFCCWTSILYFRNDKGESLAERGLSEVRLSSGKKTLVRYLALVGCVNLMFLIGYSIPSILFGTQADAWPAESQSLSYYTNGICGQGTPYACSGKNVATPRQGKAINIGPDGRLTIAPGTEIPRVVPFKTEAW